MNLPPQCGADRALIANLLRDGKVTAEYCSRQLMDQHAACGGYGSHDNSARVMDFRSSFAMVQ
jgi:hypothetical protein